MSECALTSLHEITTLILFIAQNANINIMFASLHENSVSMFLKNNLKLII